MKRYLSILFGVVAMAAVSVPAKASIVPWARVPVAKLEPRGYAHHQVLRIKQDFHPNDAYDIALDAWVPKQRPSEIELVRMWWLDTGTSDTRSPFGKGVRRHIRIDYDTNRDGSVSIRMTQKHRQYNLTVERDDEGAIHAYADVIAGGRVFEHCRVTNGRLVARKILGLPVGLRRIDVSCIDPDGATHRGFVVPERA